MLETISAVLAALPVVLGAFWVVISFLQKYLELYSLNNAAGKYPIQIGSVTLDQAYEPSIRLYRGIFLGLAGFFLLMMSLNIWLVASGNIGAIVLVLFFAIYTVASLSWFQAFRGRRLSEPSPLYRSGQINATGDFDSVFNCCKCALLAVGARIQYLDATRGYIVAHTGLTIRCFGEQIDVNVSASGNDGWNIFVASDSVLPPFGYDFGKNRSNIEIFIAGLLKECTLTKLSAAEKTIEV
jgi:hypothetical protein